MKTAWAGAVLVTALLLAAGAAPAATIDLDSGAPFPALADGDAIVSSTGVANTRLPDEVALLGGRVTFGGSGKAFGITTGRLVAADAAGSALVLSAAQDGGVRLSAEELVLAGGDFSATLEAASPGRMNELVVARLDTAALGGDAVFSVNANSRLTVLSVAGALGGGSGVTLSLAGAEAVFADSLTLANGVIAASGGALSRFAVGGDGLTLAGGSAAVLAAAGAGTSLSLTTASGSASADVRLGGTLSLQGGAVIDMGSLDIESGAAFSGGDAGRLRVLGDLAVNTDFTDAAAVATEVSGAGAVAAGVRYTVAGDGNIYAGGMSVQGKLAYAGGGDGRIRLGVYDGIMPVSKGELHLDGGGISVAGADEFAVENAVVRIARAAASGVTLDVGAASALALRSSVLVIDTAASASPAGTVVMTTGRGITAQGFTLLSGSAGVVQNSPGGRLTVSAPVTIGGGPGAAGLDIAGDAALFTGGLTLARNGSLTADNAVSGVVTLGSATAAAGITLHGGNTLRAAAGGTLKLASAHAAGGHMQVAGVGNSVRGEVDAADFSVIVGPGAGLGVATDAAAPQGLRIARMSVAGELVLGDGTAAGIVETAGGFAVHAGGLVRAAGASAVITGNAGNPLGEERFSVSADAGLVAGSGTIAVHGFEALAIDGVFTAGAAGAGSAARLLTDADVILGDSAVIALTRDLAVTATAGDSGVATRIIETDADSVIVAPGTLANSSMFGDFTFGLNDSATILSVASAANRVVLDGSAADRRTAGANLRSLWSATRFGDDFSGIVYAAAAGTIASDGTPAGDRNAGLLDAVANPAGRFIDAGTVAYMSGGHLRGVSRASLALSRLFTDGMTGRANALQLRRRHGGAGLSSAPGSGIWLDGVGLWRAGDGPGGFSQATRGMTVGYDMAFGGAFLLGAALSYANSDYEDAGALDSASRLETFSGGVYGSWSGANGVFASVFGGCTTSSVTLRDLRRDPVARRGVWTDASFTAAGWSAGGRAGYEYSPAANVLLTPSLGIEYAGAAFSDHDSFLDGVAVQRVRGVSQAGVFLPLDVSAAYTLPLGPDGALRLGGHAGYTVSLASGGLSGDILHHGLTPAAAVRLDGNDGPGHILRLGAGIGYSSPTFSIDIAYDFLDDDDGAEHRATLGMGVIF